MGPKNACGGEWGEDRKGSKGMMGNLRGYGRMRRDGEVGEGGWGRKRMRMDWRGELEERRLENIGAGRRVGGVS